MGWSMEGSADERTCKLLIMRGVSSELPTLRARIDAETPSFPSFWPVSPEDNVRAATGGDRGLSEIAPTPQETVTPKKAVDDRIQSGRLVWAFDCQAASGHHSTNSEN